MGDKKILILGLIALVSSCASQKPVGNPLAHILASENPNIRRVMDSVDQFEAQIRYTQIDRRHDSISFTDYDFQVDDKNYFYPASTVKMPIAALAMEKINRNIDLNMDTRFYVEGDTVETTFSKEITKIFALSDNEANNRLVEFLGQDEINTQLQKKGVVNVRIAHRLGVHEDDVTTKPLIIYLNDSTMTSLEGTINTPPKTLVLKGIKKGVGYMDQDSLIPDPFNFGLKNYYPISAQVGVLKRIFFPESFSKEAQFHLNPAQLEFLRNTMRIVPREAGYEQKEYPDGYGKFFIFGDTKEAIPEYINIYNKAGWAYGTLTDCAYITDTKNGVEFMLTATLLVNSNRIFNDDDYEFATVGIPFLAALGREIYAFELHRKN